MDQNALQSALEFHRAGRLADAEAIYRQALARIRMTPMPTTTWAPF